MATTTAAPSVSPSCCATECAPTGRHRGAAAVSGRPRAALLAALFIGAASLPPALFAAAFSFTGSGFGDDSRANFSFTVAAQSTVTLRTWSYAGGVNAAGQTIARGGFDPVISVFGADGRLIDDDDDGGPVVDPVSGNSYDSLLQLALSPGQYAAVLTQFANFSTGTIGGFEGSDSADIAEGRRTGVWALDILGVETASFLGVVDDRPGPSASESQITQALLDRALQDIASNASTGSTAAVISTACPRSPVGSRFREDCTPVVVGALTPQGSQLNAQAAFALNAVTAEQATIPLASAQTSLSSQRQNLASRLAALRGGASGFSIRGLALQTEGVDLPGIGDFPLGGAAGGDENPLFAGGGRLSGFINGTVTRADQDATLNQDGFEGDAWALTGGLDYRFRDNLIAGLAVGYFSSEADIDHNGGNLDTDGYSLSLYGTWYHGESFYLDGIVTYGTNSYDQRRNIAYQIGTTRVNQAASADYDGHQWSAALGTGYLVSRGAWSFGPVARAEFLSAHVDGYAEQMSDPNANGGGWAARLRPMDQESFTTSLGFDVAHAISTTWGVISPALHLDWTHEYRNSALSVAGSFIQDPTSSIFGIEADAPDSDYFNGRIGISAQFAGGSSAFLYYNRVFGYRDLDLDTFGAGIRLTF